MALNEITNYLEDDWDDNNLTGRSGASEGYFLHPSDNLISDYEAGDALKGVYRPEWNVVSGSASATNNQLELPAGDTTSQELLTTTDLTVGSISCDVFVDGAPSVGSHSVEWLRAGDSNRYLMNIRLHGGDESDLRKTESGTNSNIISTAAINTSTTHTWKVTRDSYGNFELFVDGSSQGTTTDTFLPETDEFRIWNSLDVPVDVDNLVVN